MKSEYFKVERTARVNVYGSIGPKTKYFWLVLHGSKMLSDQMIYKFQNFDPETHFVVAPEGLNRYYKEGFGGDVVASWMTKRDRLDEIVDFSNYLSDVYNHYYQKMPEHCKCIVMGFSQGGTTLYRWLHAKQVNFDCLLAYSCWIPEDIDLKSSASNLNQSKMIYTYGMQDQYLNQERIAALKAVVQKNNLDIQIEPYDGIHKIDKLQLNKLFEANFK